MLTKVNICLTMLSNQIYGKSYSLYQMIVSLTFCLGFRNMLYVGTHMVITQIPVSRFLILKVGYSVICKLFVLIMALFVLLIVCL